MRTAVLGMTFVLLLSLAGCERPQTSPAQSEHQPETLSIAAAADLRFALEEIRTAFEAAHPDVALRVTFGSSGLLFTQISEGAPFDLFLSADIEYPRQLIARGLADPDSEFRYAVGHLVLWVPNDSPLNIEQRGISALLDPAVRKIAIANPRHAPYGRAAEGALRKLEIYDQVADRLVLGENVSQAAQLVETGAADAGIFALSLALAPPMKDHGRFWQIPAESYPPLIQGGVIRKGSSQQNEAVAFKDFLTGPAGGEILLKFGFLPEH